MLVGSFHVVAPLIIFCDFSLQHLLFMMNAKGILCNFIVVIAFLETYCVIITIT